ncbi:unnamed protein product [Effrenium voratum]|nr:unnamed protein product [Effrenium voratum]
MASVWRALLAAAASLSLAGASESAKLLLFWPVDNSKRTVTQVKKNLEHVKKSLGAKCCDVFLAHYRGAGLELWGHEWYRANVVGNFSGRGYKFKFMKDAYAKALAAEESWESKYEFVWGLDSDIDITGTNLTKMFSMARMSNALIVGPTFVGRGVNWVRPHLGKHGKHPAKAKPKAKPHHQERAHNHPVRSSLTQEEAAGLELGKTGERSESAIWIFERPSSSCDYRHTDFVELTAPLLTRTALPVVFNDCRSAARDATRLGSEIRGSRGLWWGKSFCALLLKVPPFGFTLGLRRAGNFTPRLADGGPAEEPDSMLILEDMVWCKFLAAEVKHTSSQGPLVNSKVELAEHYYPQPTMPYLQSRKSFGKIYVTLLVKRCKGEFLGYADPGIDSLVKQSCALIDAAPVNHLNWRQAKVSKEFLAANRDVFHKYRRFWSGLKTLNCIVVEPAVRVSNLQELELPGHRRLIRKGSKKKASLAVAVGAKTIEMTT